MLPSHNPTPLYSTWCPALHDDICHDDISIRPKCVVLIATDRLETLQYIVDIGGYQPCNLTIHTFVTLIFSLFTPYFPSLPSLRPSTLGFPIIQPANELGCRPFHVHKNSPLTSPCHLDANEIHTDLPRETNTTTTNKKHNDNDDQSISNKPVYRCSDIGNLSSFLLLIQSINPLHLNYFYFDTRRRTLLPLLLGEHGPWSTITASH